MLLVATRASPRGQNLLRFDSKFTDPRIMHDTEQAELLSAELLSTIEWMRRRLGTNADHPEMASPSSSGGASVSGSPGGPRWHVLNAGRSEGDMSAVDEVQAVLDGRLGAQKAAEEEEGEEGGQEQPDEGGGDGGPVQQAPGLAVDDEGSAGSAGGAGGEGVGGAEEGEAPAAKTNGSTPGFLSFTDEAAMLFGQDPDKRIRGLKIREITPAAQQQILDEHRRQAIHALNAYRRVDACMSLWQQQVESRNTRGFQLMNVKNIRNMVLMEISHMLPDCATCLLVQRT